MAEKGVLFHEEVPLRTRKYIFEVKKSAKGDRYMVIREERKAKNKIRYDQIMLFNDHINEFSSLFEKAKKYLIVEGGKR